METEGSLPCSQEPHTGLDWRVDLLSTYPHDSELHAITVLSLICILNEPLEHTLKLCPLQSSLVVAW
jgi:hypothetical protein